MYANGFLAEKRRSPVSLAAVVGLHGAAIAALALYGTTQFIAEKGTQTNTFDVPIQQPPPPLPPPPRPEQDQPVQQHQSRLDTSTDPVIPLGPPVTGPQVPPQPPVGQVTERIVFADARPVIPEPVRIGAQVDPRYRDALQPPYPPDRERAQQAGRVRVRVTIGTDGRVTAIEQVDSTHDAFWRVTQRQALNRWRFRPATVDGRPVVSTMTMTVNFRIPDA